LLRIYRVAPAAMTGMGKAHTETGKSSLGKALQGLWGSGTATGDLTFPSLLDRPFRALLRIPAATSVLTLRRALVPLLAGCLSGLFSFAAKPASAQDLDRPSVNIDEDVTAFAFAPDGRVVYSVRRMYRNKKYDMQRDDIYLRDTGGRTKRIFQGEKFTVMKPF